ncbi:hypothetical protein L1987_23611 [Smallanthus sonchifolius]|uniref:Uncharacterized protein n=1 Tax=Smallanthus sonchifolius TaxID=185202 RepID=A0ACB9IJG5_9ASTR|nr:hypothetical protein L1987_23611 [Smallanthus sonchifolius]
MAICDPDSSVFLHGDLELTIFEARCLPNMDLATERVRRCLKVFHLCKSSKKSKKPKSNHKVITSDPYVSVCLTGATVARTRVISNSQYPVWNEHIVAPVAHPVSQVEFQVKDNDMFGADMIGVAAISANWIKSGELIEDWFPILGPFGKPPKAKAAVRLKLRFIPYDVENFRNSIGTDDLFGLNKSYFPMRHGCNVMLYQDAHVGEGRLPEIELEGDSESFKQRGCWEDMCHDIMEARHLVYVVGWSIFDKVKLVRETTKPLPKDVDWTLGELLKCKSQEGVKVLLLVWDDKTSHDKFFLKTV